MEKYQIIYVEHDSNDYSTPSEKITGGVSFPGINTKLKIITLKEVEESLTKVKIELEKELDEIQTKMVKDYKLKDSEKVKTLVIKKSSPMLLKFLASPTKPDSGMIIFVGDSYEDPKSRVSVCSVYGYKGVLVTEEYKIMKKEK